jgi:hypothetical protein
MHQLNSCSGGCVSRKICGPLIRLRSRRVSQYQTFGFDPDPPFSSATDITIQRFNESRQRSEMF